MKPYKDLLDLAGKAAIVTGGAMGIGYGIAYRLAEAGAKVLIADINPDAAQKTADELTAKGWTAHALKVDVSKESDIKLMIKSCLDIFGSIDILVNNAGIYPNKLIADMTAQDFDKVLEVNLRSVFLATKYVAEVMKKQAGGKIINVSSIDSLHPSSIGLAHYDASKHGVWGFSKNAALELASSHITVNAIAPGGILTPGATVGSQDVSAEQMNELSKTFLAKIPMHRMGEPDEIGMVALFLASDMSSYMTGEQIVVDGGVLLS